MQRAFTGPAQPLRSRGRQVQAWRSAPNQGAAVKSSRPSVFVSLSICLALAGSVATAHAATYYVSPNGNDSSSGTQSSPFRTVNRGVSVLNPGDTLLVRGGIYPESLM